MLSALVALLVFSGDVLDDVWNMPGSAAPTHSSHQHKGGAAKANSAGHDDAVTVGSALASPAPLAPRRSHIWLSMRKLPLEHRLRSIIRLS